MKFFITGKTGFIGQWLMKELPNVAGIGSEIDIRDYDKLRNTILKARPTHVIHLAAISNPQTCEDNPKLAYSVNVQGTENVLKASKEIGAKTTIISTSKIYNDQGVYAETKRKAEEIAQEYEATIIRPYNQEGPGRQTEYFTSKVIKAALNGTPIELWHPNLIREYMDVRDGAEAIKIISLYGEGTYDLSTGQGMSKLEYVKLVEQVLNKKIKYTIGKDTDKRRLVGDNTKLKELGWVQKHNIEQTIRDQAQSLQ